MNLTMAQASEQPAESTHKNTRYIRRNGARRLNAELNLKDTFQKNSETSDPSVFFGYSKSHWNKLRRSALPKKLIEMLEAPLPCFDGQAFPDEDEDEAMQPLIWEGEDDDPC